MNTFECDKHKARMNRNKHSIRFTDAARSIKSGYSLTERSPQSDDLGEERNLTITRQKNGRTIVIVWTPREKNVRIISARHARKNEKEVLNAYLKKLQ